MKNILHFVKIDASPDKVFWALTTGEGLAGWWSTEVHVPEIGGGMGMLDFRFGGDFNPDMAVTDFEPGHKVGWKCVGGHSNWQDSTFSFDLRSEGEQTGLLFKQVYAEELKDETYGTNNYNWGYFLNSLKQFCETGSGRPVKP